MNSRYRKYTLLPILFLFSVNIAFADDSPFFPSLPEDITADMVKNQEAKLNQAIKAHNLSDAEVIATKNEISEVLYGKSLEKITDGANNNVWYKVLNIAGTLTDLQSVFSGFKTGTMGMGASFGDNQKAQDEAMLVYRLYCIDRAYLYNLTGIRTVVPDKITNSTCVTISDIELRYGPSANNDSIRQIKKYTKIKIIDKKPKNGWVKVKIDKEEGCVDGELLYYQY
ncbi:MAG: hypothetical protein LBM77_09760 [Spirochaetaceae bacterium]|jgi:hypothetical protein|nr:hypothetical protein [Spirochaetaceae bacterium]